jgi:hypothetical protein
MNRSFGPYISLVTRAASSEMCRLQYRRGEYVHIRNTLLSPLGRVVTPVVSEQETHSIPVHTRWEAKVTSNVILLSCAYVEYWKRE